MSWRWTDRDRDALTNAARIGLSAEQITAAYNRSRGVTLRTVYAVRGQMNHLRIRYGNHAVKVWTNAELRVMRSMGGRCAIPEIQQALADECGSERSIGQIRHRLGLLKISWTPDESVWISTERAAYLLGASTRGVILWCLSGELRCERFGAGKWGKRFIKPEWLDALIDSLPPRFDPAAMPPSRYRSRVELRLREGRYLTAPQAVTVSGCPVRTIYLALLSGELPAIKVRRGAEGGQPRW